MPSRLRGTAFVVIVAISAQAGAAAPTLDALFQDHAGACSADHVIVVGGTAAPGAIIRRHSRPACGGAGRRRREMAGHAPAAGAGGPFDLEVRDAAGAARLPGPAHRRCVAVFRPSNIEMQVRRVANLETGNRARATAGSGCCTLSGTAAWSSVTQIHTAGALARAGPGTVDNFSAACFFFGREIEHSEGVPVGPYRIRSWGGSHQSRPG